MICQKRQNYSKPPVDTARGNVEFCNALPEGSGFVLLRRDKVYLPIRLRIKLRRTSRGAGLRQGSRLPAMCHRTLISHKLQIALNFPENHCRENGSVPTCAINRDRPLSVSRR